MNKTDFKKWFKSGFWRAFTDRTIPIMVPDKKERNNFLDRVYNDIISFQYIPNIPEVELIVNKGYGIARIVPVFSIQDYCVYYFCVKELEDVLCESRTPNTFGGWTLGGKMRKQEYNEVESEIGTDYGRFSFNPQAWAQAFGEFNSMIFAQLDPPSNYSYVLQLDISNFYDCVRLDILERLIRESAPSNKSRIITLLFYFLNYWNRHNTEMHPQVVGLPQDALADCSRILANFYLQQYDEFAASICNQAGAVYFRYADDQMILLNDPDKIDNILLVLTRKLDRFGLRINQKKVILWQTPELIKHRCRCIQAIFSNKDDNKNPKLVLEFVKQYLSLESDELSSTWNNGMPLLNRLLWANLPSLPITLFEEILTRLTREEFLLCATAKKLEQINNLNSRRSSPVNFSELIQTIATKCVHNSFHYEAQSYAKISKNTRLYDFLTARITKLNEMMHDNIIENCEVFRKIT